MRRPPLLILVITTTAWLVGPAGSGSTAAEAPGTAGGGRTIDTVAGTGVRGYGGDGGQARSATFNEPRHVVPDAAGALYVSDTLNHRLRRIDPSGVVTTVAGTGTAGFGGDGGPATGAAVSWPHAVVLDPAGANLYLADTANHRVRRIEVASGLISTVAGTGAPGFGGDGGPATAALLNGPKGLAVGPAGDLWIADSGNDRIRRVAASTGVISTVAGNGTTGYGGDGGPGAAAAFDSPRALAFDAAGNLYIADSMNHKIRMVDPAGTIITLAGIGREGFGGDGGPAADAKLFIPRGVAAAPAGSVYVADTNNGRIRRISPAA
ncbi:MAG: hypothetical protein ACRDY7_07185 [Acidimicrobiia bacterium]